MNNPSNKFIKDTILKLLGAIGSEKEINKYIEKLIKVRIYNTFTNDQKTGNTICGQKRFQKIASP